MVRVKCLLASCTLMALLLLIVPTSAYPSPGNLYRDEIQYDPEEVMEIVNRLNNFLEMERKMETEKRAIDVGLGRGYSGTLQAKHLMGIAAANYAGGPGRRRRDAN